MRRVVRLGHGGVELGAGAREGMRWPSGGITQPGLRAGWNAKGSIGLLGDVLRLGLESCSEGGGADPQA